MPVFLSKLVGVLKLLWATMFGELIISAAINVIETVGKPAVDDFVKAAKAKVEAVEEEYADRPGSGILKHKEVFDYLADYAAAKGLELGASVINLLIETILVSLRTI